MSDSIEGLTEVELGLLLAASSESEWGEACDKIKSARNGQYPYDWFAKILATGFMTAKQKEWAAKDDECKMTITVKPYEAGKVSTEVETSELDNQTMVMLGALDYAKRVIMMDAQMDEGIKRNMQNSRL